MTDTRPILVTTSILVHAPLDNEASDEIIDRVSERFVEAVKQIVSTDPMLESPRVSTFHYLGEDNENARLCSRCGEWTSDYNLPQVIDGLPLGHEIEGVFRCDYCHYLSSKESA